MWYVNFVNIILTLNPTAYGTFDESSVCNSQRRICGFGGEGSEIVPLVVRKFPDSERFLTLQ